MSAFKSNISRRAAQTVQFAKQLKEEIISVLSHMHRKQTDELHRIQKQITMYGTVAQTEFAKMKKSKNKMTDSHRLREQQFIRLQILKARFFYSKLQQEKLANRVRKAEKQFLTNQASVKDTMKQYNTFVTNYYAQLDKNLLLLQKHQTDRFNQMISNMKKILVFQVSMMKNFEYDVTNLSMQLEGVGDAGSRDIKEMVKKYEKKEERKELEKLPKFNFIDAVLLGSLQKELDKKIKMDRNEEIRGLVSRIVKGDKVEQGDVKILDRDKIEYLHQISTFLQINAELIQAQTIKDTFDKSFDSPECRCLARLCLRIKIQNLTFQTSSLHQLLLEFLLDKSYKKKDVFCIRAITKTIFTQLSMKTPKRKSQILYGQLIHLKIWKDQTFWSAFMFQSIQQRLKMRRSKKGECFQQAMLQEQSVILSEIMNTCHMMLMFGFAGSKTRKIAEKYEKFYELTENERVKFLKLINESSCGYSEIWTKQMHQQDQEIDFDYD